MVWDWLAFILIAFLGLVLCFLGYRAFLGLLPLWAFLSSIWLGYYTVSWSRFSQTWETIVAIVVGIGIGIIIAAVAYWVFKIGFTFVAAILTGTIIAEVLSALGVAQGLLTSIVFLAVIIGTVLLVNRYHLEKYGVILITALVGADLIVLAFLRLSGAMTISDLHVGNLFSPVLHQSWLSLTAFLVFAVLGFAVQVMINRNYEYTPPAPVKRLFGG